MENRKTTIFLTIALILVCAVSIMAAIYLKLIGSDSDIRLVINGKMFLPEDENGSFIDVMLIGNTPYVPIRAVGDELGLDVTYDSGTKTVFISGKAAPSSSNYQSDEYPDAGDTPDFTLSPSEGGEITFGDMFIFDGVEITIHDGVQMHKVENSFADEYDTDVFSVPITIKNISGETHSLSAYNMYFYSPAGIAIDKIHFYFDDDFSRKGDMRSGATLESKMFIMYKGDGDYWIEFKTYDSKTFEPIKLEVRLPIARP